MVKRALAGEFEGGPGDLARLQIRLLRLPPGVLELHDDVVAVVDAGGGRADAVKCPHQHLGVLVAGERRARRNHAVVEVAFVVEDSASAGAAADVEGSRGIFNLVG